MVSTQARFTEDGRQIITESLVKNDQGTLVTITQLGGKSQGYRMVVLHSHPILQQGDTITALVANSEATPTRYSLRQIVSYQKAGEPAQTNKQDTVSKFVRTPSGDSNIPIAWASGCVSISSQQDGTNNLAGDIEFTIIDNVLNHWQEALDSCSYLQINTLPRSSLEGGFDGNNVILFRDDTWCRPAFGDTPQICHNPSAAGITIITFVDDANSSRDGEIVDADIEINGVNFAVSQNGNSLGTASCASDLANTLTHEVGHLLGIDHTCWTGSGDRLLDDQGNLVPACSEPNLPAAITEATMYNFQQCLETKKASLEADDRNAVCSAYPLAADPNQCSTPDLGNKNSGCCQTGGPIPFLPATLVLLVLFGKKRILPMVP